MNLIVFLIFVVYVQFVVGQLLGVFWMMFLVLIVLIVVMYFLMICLQMKCQKEYKVMLEKIKCGDEVLINGGIVGVVIDIGDNFIIIEVVDNVCICVQKGVVGNVLLIGMLKLVN